MKTLLALGLTASLVQAAPPPPLRPGEALAVAVQGGEVAVAGEARVEGPLGGLACLPWLRLEGHAWSSGRMTYTCRADGTPCTEPKGHGWVDMSRAFQRGCRKALLAWIQVSAAGWAKAEGPVAARLKLDEVFQPFTGRRVPPGEGLPEFGPGWAGEGDLLRASPEGLARWLADPAQEGVESMYRRYGSGFFEGDVGDYHGWTYAARAGAGTAETTWVAGGRRGGAAVLRLPGAVPRESALRRFRELLPAQGR